MGAGADVVVDGRPLLPPRTGIGSFLAVLLQEWGRSHPGRVQVLLPAGERVPLPAGVEPIELPPPFHLRAAWRSRRSAIRYFSADSLIVPAVLGRRAVVAVHDLVALRAPELHRPRVRLAFRWLLPLALRRVDAVVVPSEATADELRRRWSRARVRVVGASARRLDATGPLPAGVRPPYLLYVGALEPRKHVPDLAERFLDSAPPGWQLVLAGPMRWLDAADRNRLERARADARLQVLGMVPDDVLGALYVNAEAFAYISSDEGFGLPVLEAMRVGLPVLTTTAPALLQLTGGCALHLDLAARDPYGEPLREALTRLLTDDVLRAELGERAQQRAERFGPGAFATAAWRHVVGTRGAPDRS